ncbi:MAG: CHAT domain-containing protein [Acidobacteriota bacterium]
MSDDHSDSTFRRGLAALQGGRLAHAQRLLAQALREGGPERSWACQELVNACLRRKDPERAEELLAEILDPTDPLLLHGRGYLARRLGRNDEALALFEEAFAHPERPLAVLCELGWMRLAAGLEEEGRALLTEAHLEFEERGDLWGAASALTHLATHATVLFRLEEAEDLLGRARQAKEACGDLLGLATVHYNVGYLHFTSARHLESLPPLEKALELQRRLRFKEGMAFTLNVIACCRIELGDLDLAADLLRANLRLQRGLAQGLSTQVEASVRSNLGLVASLRDRPRTARRQYEKALELAVARGDAEEQATVTANLCFALRIAGRYSDALAIIDSTPELSGATPRSQAMLASERVRLLLKLDRNDEALVAARHVTNITRQWTEDEQALAVQAIEANVCLGLAHAACGDIAEARKVLNETVARVDQLVAQLPSAHARSGLAELLRSAEDCLVDHLVDEGDSFGAWERIRQAKAQELALTLRRGRRSLVTDDRIHPLEVVEAELRLLISAPELGPSERRRLQELRTRHRLLLSELDDDARLAEGSDESSWSAHELLEKLDPSVVLVEYFTTERTTWAFRLHRGELEVFDLRFPGTRVRRAIHRYREPFEMAGSGPEASLALRAVDWERGLRLHRKLIAPVLADLADEDLRLILCPDGPLHGLVFETLPLDDCGDEFLIDRHELALLPSSQLWRAARAWPRSPRVVAFAHSPESERTIHALGREHRVGPLPALDQELEAWRRHFPKLRIVADREANAAAYVREAGEADILHLAAHGFADPLTPALSGLALMSADGATLDLLTAEQVARHPLVARLVLLSACESAGGELRVREGVHGLVRSFLEAGGEAVLASAWRVDDEATAAFMKLLVPALLERKGDRVAAVASARRRFRAWARKEQPGWDHPYFWGALGLTDLAPQPRG